MANKMQTVTECVRTDDGGERNDVCVQDREPERILQAPVKYHEQARMHDPGTRRRTDTDELKTVEDEISSVESSKFDRG